MRVSYYHTNALNDAIGLQHAILSLVGETPATIETAEKSRYWKEIDKKDAWGRKMEIIECDRTTPRGDRYPIHVYSLGQDGMSNSNGNDPDDINTWGDHHQKFYWTQIRNEESYGNLIQSLWQAPLLFIILMLIIQFIRHAK